MIWKITEASAHDFFLSSFLVVPILASISGPDRFLTGVETEESALDLGQSVC